MSSRDWRRGIHCSRRMISRLYGSRLGPPSDLPPCQAGSELVGTAMNKSCACDFPEPRCVLAGCSCQDPAALDPLYRRLANDITRPSAAFAAHEQQPGCRISLSLDVRVVGIKDKTRQTCDGTIIIMAPVVWIAFMLSLPPQIF